MNYQFSDIVDIQTVQSLLEGLWDIIGIHMAIISADGKNILVSVGWEDVCVNFHRKHPQAAKDCQQSDKNLQQLLSTGTPLPACGYYEYTCLNGLVDIAVPIIINGEHLVNLSTGQFLHAEPNENYFKELASRFNFDEEPYLEALHKVPIVSPQKVKEIVTFLSRFVNLLTRMGVEKLEQLETQKKLQESEEKFRILFEHSNDAAYILSPEGQFIEVNQAACRLHGYSKEELLQMPMPELLAPERASNFIPRVEEITSKGKLIFETIHRRKDGTRFIAEVSVCPFDYLGKPALLCSLRDISERKQAEEALCESERKHATLLANLPGMVYHCRNDHDCTMEFISDGCHELTGYFPAELLSNHTLSFNDIIHPDDRKRVRQQIQSSVRDQQPFQLEYRIRTQTGKTLWVWERGRGVFSPEGDVLALEGFITDITEQRVAEEALRQNEKKFRSLSQQFRTVLDAIPDIIVLLSPELQVIWGNQASTEYRQQDISVIEGEACYKTFHNRTEPCPVCPALRAFYSGKTETDVVTRRNGSIWELKVFPLKNNDGKVINVIEIASNITERKHSEQALRESEKRYRAVVEDQTELICRFFPDGRLSFVNEAYCRYFGKKRAELLGHKFMPLIPTEDQELCTTSINALGQDNPTGINTHRVIRHDGVVRWLRWTNRAILGTAGQILEYQSTGQDITERKQAEQRLQATHRNLQDIIEFLPDATFVIDQDKKLVAWNRAIETMTGVRKENIIGQGDYAYAEAFYGTRQPILIDLIDRPDTEIEAKYDFVKRKGDTLITETYIPSLHNGQGSYLMAMAAPLFDHNGRIVGAIESIRDISDLKKAEALANEAQTEAEQARDKIETILKSVADGLIVTDLDGRVILMNRMAEQLAATPFSKAFTCPLEKVFNEQTFSAQVSATLNNSKEQVVEWVTAERPPHPSRTIQARSTAVQSGDGRLSGVVSILRDVTRERDLDRMKNEFISTAAHELRTPLTSVLGFAEILINPEEYGITDPVQKKDLLTTIQEKAQQLGNIISDLLDLSRIQSGHLISLKKAPCDMNKLLAKMVSYYQKGPEQHCFEINLPKTPIQLSVDEGKLEQVLDNLISNAVKFSPQDTSISITSQVTDNHLEVSIEDQGIGMTNEQIERVFDKFYRVDASATAKEGLGLGMAIVKSIIEAHGGATRVESELGKGTTVVFSLPLEAETHA
ncbi:MAG: PAS domain S-box protein [Desulfuromonas sp.]|nr:PAS domain S-box protein [Desulfuromonas sp.]